MRHRSIIRRAGFACVAGLVLVMAVVPVRAQDSDVPYCPHTEPYAPHGIVLRMGQEYYRTCGNWSKDGDLPWRQFILITNPSQVPDLFSSYSASVLRVVERVNGIDRQANAIRRLAKKRPKSVGHHRYEVYESKLLPISGKPSWRVFVLQSEEHSDVPDHWVKCTGWNRVEQGGSLSCDVHVLKGDVYGSLLFIGSHERGLNFLNHFAGFAQDIERVLTYANVTDRMDEMQTFLDIVE